MADDTTTAAVEAAEETKKGGFMKKLMKIAVIGAAIAGIVAFVPPVTSHSVPSLSSSVTSTPVTGSAFGLKTVMVPVTWTLEMVPSSCDTSTV